MFCNNCGKEVEDDQKFCTNCGKNIENTVPGSETTSQPNPAAYNQQYAPNQEVYQKSYISSAPTDVNRKKVTQATAAVFTALTIMTMLLSWFTIKVSVPNMSYFPSDLNDIKTSCTSFQVGSVVHQVNDFCKAILKEIKSNRGSDFDEIMDSNSEFGSIRKMTRSIGVVSFVMGLVKIMIIAANVLLLLFLYMMLVENENGALMGQLGSTLAFFAAIIFAILFVVSKISISNFIDDMGGGDIGDGLDSISISMGVYLTMAMAALNLVFITMRKSILRGE